MHFKHITAALATLAIGGALAVPAPGADGPALAVRDADKDHQKHKDDWDEKLKAREDDHYEKKWKGGRKYKDDDWDDKLKIRDDGDDWDDKKLMARDDDGWRKHYHDWKDDVDDFFDDDQKLKARDKDDDDDHKKDRKYRYGKSHDGGDRYGRNRWDRIRWNEDWD